MPDEISDIRDFYDKNVEKEDGRLVRHPIEHDVSWRYLDKYLPSSGKILDVGAATGAYTLPLARRGYSVTAADISPALVKSCEKQVRETGLEDKVTCLVSDARDLSGVKETGFDAALLMGPLYHLVLEEDRKTAIREVRSKLKPGGTVFSSFISRYGIWGDVMTKLPHFIEYRDDLKSVLERGRDTEIPAWGAGFRAYFTTADEIAPLHEKLGFETLALAGVEPVGVAADAAYAGLSEERRKMWLDLMFAISTEKSIIGASCHLLYIGKKSIT